MDARQAVPFRSPDSMAVQITVPNAGQLSWESCSGRIFLEWADM